jgi:hypothetical protein
MAAGVDSSVKLRSGRDPERETASEVEIPSEGEIRLLMQDELA